MDLFPAPEDLTEGVTAEQRTAAADWEALIEIRVPVLKALDVARDDKIIGSSLEAAVTLKPSPLLNKYKAELPGLFIVSVVELSETSDTIHVEHARGEKCERCWKYTLDVGSDEAYPTACASCAKIVREYF
jgi:isoleucyl-tRNA synthetase